MSFSDFFISLLATRHHGSCPDLNQVRRRQTRDRQPAPAATHNRVHRDQQCRGCPRCDQDDEGRLKALLHGCTHSHDYRKIRGAPAIASLAALSVSQHLTRGLRSSPLPDYLNGTTALKTHVDKILAYLYTARPTAVNLGAATRRLTKTLDDGIAAGKDPKTIAEELVAEGKAVADEDVGRNKEMARWAGEWLLQRVQEQGIDASKGLNVLTVCNTGSLATSVGFIPRLESCEEIVLTKSRATAQHSA